MCVVAAAHGHKESVQHICGVRNLKIKWATLNAGERHVCCGCVTAATSEYKTISAAHLWSNGGYHLKIKWATINAG
jgi:hypothetical protein